MPYYVIVTSDPRAVKRVLRILRRHADSHIVAVAVVVYTDKYELLGGITKVGEVSVVRGYLLPLPVLQ